MRLVATPALATAILPAAMTPWCKAFPNASCSLATHHTREIVSALLLASLLANTTGYQTYDASALTRWNELDARAKTQQIKSLGRVLQTSGLTPRDMRAVGAHLYTRQQTLESPQDRKSVV